MTLNGYLSEFSLGEIFQVIEQGKKTGLLSIRDLFDHNHGLEYHLWFKQGRIITASNRKDDQGLELLIKKRRFLGDSAYHQLYQSWSQKVPLGFHLKSQGAITYDQLKLLFVTQVMQQVCKVFKVDQGFFHFEPDIYPSFADMTGLTKPATELTLVGLRMLKNWAPLSEKLPSESSGLVSLIHTQPSYSLNAKEWQVWEYTKGTIPLKIIAQQLQLSLEQVQQITFRLIVIGLAEELPMVAMMPPEPKEMATIETEQTQQPAVQEQPTVSNSFLNHLTSFLKAKGA